MNLSVALTCDVGQDRKVEVRRSSKTTKGRRVVEFSLFLKTDSEHPLAVKHVPWPKGDEAPNKIYFSEKKKCVLLKGGSTILRIPVILPPTISDTVVCPRKYEDFDVNPVAVTEEISVLNALREVINHSENDKVWKSFRKSLSSYDGSLGGIIPPAEQNALLSLVEKRVGSSKLEELCLLLSTRSVFGFRKQQDFYLFCINNDFHSIVSEAISRSVVVSEEIMRSMIKFAASQPADQGELLLQSILDHGFNESSLASSNVAPLTGEEFTTVVQWCTKIFNDADLNHIAPQALSLMSALIDSHGARLVWDAEAHDKVIDICQDVSDLAALSELFAHFEAKAGDPSTKSTDVLPVFRVRKAALPVRKITW